MKLQFAPHRTALGAAAVVAATLSLLLFGCGRQPPAGATVSVVVALPVHAQPNSADAVAFPVEAAARYANAASFRVAGKLIERNVRLGDVVRRNQELARLDGSDAQQQLAGAQAALDAASHRLAFARQQLDRDSAQAGQNLIAATQLEQTQDAYTSAFDAHEQAAAQVTVARNNLRYQTLYADHDGVITSENADTGQVVAAGQPVYGLAWSTDTDVTLDAPEGRLGAMSVGEHAMVTFPALPDRSFAAAVREISPAADPQSRTFRVKLSLIPPYQDVRMGMTGQALFAPADVSGTHSDSHYFVLPATAIFHQGSQPAVWIVGQTDSTLELRLVKTIRYDSQSATISEGLRDSDEVVLAGVHTVHAGEKVRTVAPLFTPAETTR
jgi:multidrug efflux system membrane fusion protein